MGTQAAIREVVRDMDGVDLVEKNHKCTDQFPEG